ncbi:hypothetical protein [Planctopirus limnophila]|uniref:hypothetical protein n=1 Tax=Planctopirus limnophila TaxID=120 RepID=UPI0002F98019|nr:hypothetical protein [Planctopirus limnophila]
MEVANTGGLIASRIANHPPSTHDQLLPLPPRQEARSRGLLRGIRPILAALLDEFGRRGWGQTSSFAPRS